MSAPRLVRLRALAKLNLDLRVLHRRPDGFHELRTIFQTISLGDTLELAFTPGRRTEIALESTVTIEENIAARAARLVLEALGRRGRVEMRLEKKVPMGAGLGGGSADAAAVLLGLPVLAGGVLETPRLMELALQLGSDVPFFLLGGRAAALGRGEELYPLPDLPPARALLVCPGLHVSTPAAFRALSPRLTAEAQQNKIFSFQSQVWGEGWEAPRNDFEPVVFEQFPELARLKQKLTRLGAEPALMSGSGSALFGLFRTPQGFARAVKSFGSEVAVFPITLVGRARYRSLWRRQLNAHMSKQELWPPRSRYVR